MMGLPFAFTYAPVLMALVALPAIWWLMRVFPPRPRTEELPSTRLLLDIARKEEEPARTPWWLLLMRLLLAAFIIIALAGPIFRPSAEIAPGDGPLLLVVDNGWASAPRWKAIVETAGRINRLAEEAGRPVALVATAEGTGQPLGPTDAASVEKRLEALAPRPYAADYPALLPALSAVEKASPFGGVAWLSDGIGGDGPAAFAGFLTLQVAAPIAVYADSRSELVGLKPPTGSADALVASLVRRDSDLPAAGFVRASDLKGRTIGDAPYSFAAGKAATEARFTLPVELRNDIVRLEVVGAGTAGGVQLLDERWRRRRIGLLSGAAAETTAQPLLSPLYYISRAIQPFADVREPRDANAAVAVPELIDAGASVIAMADIGTLTPDVEENLANWVLKGGTLIRFAGPRLAAATDALIPVQLRHGDRVLGGTLTWQQPEPLASFSADGPFAGMTVPPDVLVKRQVLAEPDAELASRTWASLADGTPLVTAHQSGKGWLVLFHVTADTSWSNLPLSGAFVDMLRRIVAFSSAAKRPAAKDGEPAATLAPFRLLDGYGRFVNPGSEAQPILADATVAPGRDHPPGLYGAEEGFTSLNLLDDNATLPPFDPALLQGASLRPYPSEAPIEIRPALFAAALALFLLDALAVLWLNGGLSLRRRAATAALVAGLAVLLTLPPGNARADEAADKLALQAVDKTHLAYVITGNPELDANSKAGLHGLSTVLAERTALEPGDPIGVDPSRDELAFFPLLYWPIDPTAPLPDPATMARVDAYMRQGGSVLFDTRDQLDRSTTFGTLSGTPAVEYLRQMLANLDVPPLEPVPADHVLTKAFYLLNDFPGRYAGGPLWVESSENDADRIDRPAQAGDGVSTILITENDFASAWATDASGNYMFPTVPTDPRQREMAYRAGVNIVMYTLTGNYKADQVHVPALLERLGQ